MRKFDSSLHLLTLTIERNIGWIDQMDLYNGTYYGTAKESHISDSN